MGDSSPSVLRGHHFRDSATDEALLRRCVDAARAGPEANPNPRVGALIVDASGEVAGVGHHQGAGTAHAEVEALAAAAGAAQGGTAYVSLEPCAHHGRTPPCTQALLDSGIARVVYAHADPDARAAGGAAWLTQQGVTTQMVPLPEAEELLRYWSFAIAHGRPWVTWKYAATLDGRIAADDGSSAWITSTQSRADVHVLRSRCGAIVVGTGTALADNPTLSARRDDGTLHAEQPLRVVVGQRALSHAAPAGSFLQFTDRDPHGVMASMHTRGVRRVLLEGGPTLAAQWWQAGLVDDVVAYLAPALLGRGAAAVGDLGIGTIGDIARLDITDVTQVGPDLRITARPSIAASNDERGA